MGQHDEGHMQFLGKVYEHDMDYLETTDQLFKAFVDDEQHSGDRIAEQYKTGRGLYSALKDQWYTVEKYISGVSCHRNWHYDILACLVERAVQGAVEFPFHLAALRLLLAYAELKPCKLTFSEESLKLIYEGDATALVEAEKNYGSSWKARGGVGAFMMLARKWDRLELQVGKFSNNILCALAKDTRKEGVIDDIRDLRRYLILVSAEVHSWAHTNLDDDGRLMSHSVQAYGHFTTGIEAWADEPEIKLYPTGIKHEPTKTPEQCSHENLHGNPDAFFCVDCGSTFKVSAV